MTKPIVLLAALLLAGCTKDFDLPVTEKECLPCYGVPHTVNEPKGFRYMFGLSSGRWIDATNCIPCAKAKTPEQRFVCFGETVEAPSTFETRVVVGGGAGGASARRGYPLHKTREYKDQDGKTWSEYSKETK